MAVAKHMICYILQRWRTSRGEGVPASQLGCRAATQMHAFAEMCNSWLNQFATLQINPGTKYYCVGNICRGNSDL